MKVSFSFMLMFLCTMAYAQDQYTLSRDTLTIRQTNIAEDPFKLGANPLKGLFKSRKEKPTMVKKSVVENSYVENKMDTSIEIKFGNDKFTFYKWDIESNALTSAHVTSARFSTRQGIKTGMRKADVIKALTSYAIKTIPHILVLENLEVPQNVRFEFKKDLLVAIDFSGYID